MENTPDLFELLDYLAYTSPTTNHNWQGWRIQPITGGLNNLLYRVINGDNDWAIKFTRRDERDRAGREYNTLRALELLQKNIAPKALFIERNRYQNLVMVQTWLEGMVSEEIPTTQSSWTLLIDHLLAIHTVTQEQCPVQLPDAVLSPTSAQALIGRVDQQIALIPAEGRSQELNDLSAHISAHQFPIWPEPVKRLCRSDPNILNFVRRATKWYSVDWENSGWGDPAFELADLMAHPRYLKLSLTHWQWFAERYCDRWKGPLDKERFLIRLHTYRQLTLVWWVARLTRAYYELVHGTEAKRLAEQPEGREKSLPIQIKRYVRLAQSALKEPE